MLLFGDSGFSDGGGCRCICLVIANVVAVVIAVISPAETGHFYSNIDKRQQKVIDLLLQCDGEIDACA